ncbi:hypothetical protein GN956_G10254 [Arapaima gigas]
MSGQFGEPSLLSCLLSAGQGRPWTTKSVKREESGTPREESRVPREDAGNGEDLIRASCLLDRCRAMMATR